MTDAKRGGLGGNYGPRYPFGNFLDKRFTVVTYQQNLDAAGLLADIEKVGMVRRGSKDGEHKRRPSKEQMQVHPFLACGF